MERLDLTNCAALTNETIHGVLRQHVSTLTHLRLDNCGGKQHNDVLRQWHRSYHPQDASKDPWDASEDSELTPPGGQPAITSQALAVWPYCPSFA